MYISILNSVGVVFALGHFYFAYKYYFKKHGMWKTIILFTVSILTSYAVLLGTRSITSVSPALLFSALVIFLFTLHHSHDLYKFKNFKSSLFWLLYGLTLSVLFLLFPASEHSKIIIYSMIWVMVFHHYFYWIYISYENILNKKYFIFEMAVVHILIAIIYGINHSYIDNSLLNILYSLPLFYFLTLVHVSFSFMKDTHYIHGK